MADALKTLHDCRDEHGGVAELREWEVRIEQDRVSRAGELLVLRTNLLAMQICARRDLTRERIVELADCRGREAKAWRDG